MGPSKRLTATARSRDERERRDPAARIDLVPEHVRGFRPRDGSLHRRGALRRDLGARHSDDAPTAPVGASSTMWQSPPDPMPVTPVGLPQHPRQHSMTSIVPSIL